MKREDKRILKEKEKSLEKAIRLLAKGKGYKSIMGFPYKTIDGFLYTALISTSFKDYSDEKGNKSFYCPQLYVSIQSKPLILDEIFWKIFGMYEDAQKQPESFHVSGAFTADDVIIDNFYQDFYEEENQEIVAEKVLEKVTLSIENSRKKIADLDTFETFINECPNQELNKILISIIKKDYSKAENMIDYCIKNGTTGGFMSGDNWKSIIERAKEYIHA
jgi:hypothetical protein